MNNVQKRLLIEKIVKESCCRCRLLECHWRFKVSEFVDERKPGVISSLELTLKRLSCIKEEKEDEI